MTAGQRVVIDEQNPWPGLDPFDEAADRFFNGRGQESAALRRLVLHAPLTVLFGGSGLGKTSLLQAGLFPLLRRDRILPVWLRLDARERTAPLIDQVKQALQAQIQEHHIDAPVAGGDESLWEYLHRASLELWSEQNQLLTPLFVLDQFEEIFTQGADNPGAIARLRTDLADLIENRPPASLAVRIQKSEAAGADLSLDSRRYKVLISFREDFLPAVEGWRPELPSILHNRLRLLPMSEEQAVEAVHTTAPHLVDQPLARRIVRRVSAAQDGGIGGALGTPESVSGLVVEPALLSLVCRGLNEKRKAQRKASFDEALFGDRGSVQSIISDYYQKAVGDQPERVQVFIEKELITERGFRKPCDVDDARTLHRITDQDLQLLVDRRLLRIERRHPGDRLELIHDLLTPTVRERRDRRREKERARARWQRRRLAILGAVLVAVSALTVVFGALWRKAGREARIAHSGRLAMAALLNRESQLDLASLLSVEAGRFVSTFEARNALLSTFQSNPSLRTYLHHRDAVYSVAFSGPNGKFLASANNDQTVWLWDVASRQPWGEPLKGHEGAVWSVAFSPDGKILASASADQTVGLWDVASRQPLGERLKRHEASVYSVAFSPDGRILASASLDQTVGLWDVASRKPLGEPLSGHEDYVNSVVFSPDGKILASASNDQTVRLWDVASQRLLGVLAGHTSGVNSVAFRPDGKMLASAGNDQTVRLWDVAHRRQLKTLAGHTSGASSVAFSSEGKVLASASLDGTVRLWDVASGQVLEEPLKGHRDRVTSVAFSPNGQTLASASEDRTVLLWDVARQQGEPLKGHGKSVTGVAFCRPDGKILASASEDRTVLLWDVASRQPLGEPLKGHGSEAWSVALSPDGKILASASGDQTVRLWDVASRQPLGEPLRGHTSWVNSVAFGPDGRILASAGEDKTVRLWDVASRRLLRILEGHTSGVKTVTFRPDGKILASGSEDKAVRLWEVASGRLLGELVGHTSGVKSVAFSPDGEVLASASNDQTVRLWDVARRQPLGDPLKGHASGVTSVAFSPDGKILASASYDKAVRLWDVASRQPLGEPLKGHTSEVSSVAFSPDGKILASAGADQTVRLWKVSADSWSARPCHLANRNLSLAEWRQHVGPDTPYHRTCPALPPGESAPAQ